MRHARIARAPAAGVGLGLLLTLTVARAAVPQTPNPPEAPCPGCILRLPAGAAWQGARPLLVALHGDNGTPAQLAELLQAEAERRGFAVLALACPRQLGCDRRSFWQWGGAPSFITEQVDALLRSSHGAAGTEPGRGAARIDPQRLYLLAWSGGASYLTSVMAQLPSRFAAVALLGGGMPGPQVGACARCPVPVYYMLGARNPLASLAESARDALKACGHPLRFVSLPGADHAGEWNALRRGQLATLLTFFSEHTLSCPP